MINKKTKNLLNIYNYFWINTDEYKNFSPNIHYTKDINNYLQKEFKIKNTIFISLWAPIIKNETIKKLNSEWSVLLNSHIWTSNYPWITPYLWASYKKDFKNIWFILHRLTDQIDKWDIFIEKKLNLKNLYYKFWILDINFLSTFLLLFSACNIFSFLSKKNYKINNNDDILFSTYNNNISSYFVTTYFHELIANYNLKKYLLDKDVY